MNPVKNVHFSAELRGKGSTNRGSSRRWMCHSFHFHSLPDSHCIPPPNTPLSLARVPAASLPTALPRRALPAASLPQSVAHCQPAPGSALLPHLTTINFAFNLCCIIAFSWGFPIYTEGKMQLLGLEIFCYLFLLKCEHFYLCSLETHATVGLILSTYSMHFSSIMITELLHNISGIADFPGFVALYLPKHLKRNLSVIGMLWMIHSSTVVM